MIRRIILASVKFRVLVYAMVIAILMGGSWALLRIPIDALPDLSDTQVIVVTQYEGQAPQVVEDQVTFPLTTALLSVPHAKVVRGLSEYGRSLIYIVFDDGTDLYWGRSRVLEYLNAAQNQLPAGVTPILGPDASAVGWVYQYVLTSMHHSLAELRSLQDWVLRFRLAAGKGVAEVASVGGVEKQYQIIVDPQKLQAYNLPLSQVMKAVRNANRDVGGRTIELAETEYIIQAHGYIKTLDDIRQIVVSSGSTGNPVLLADIADIRLGPQEKRGIAEYNGMGQTAAGIVIKRDGADALTTIESVKRQLQDLKQTLPHAVEVKPVYDRSQLIAAAMNTLRHTLLEESLIVAVVCIIFLWHIRSAFVAIISLPLGILLAFCGMYALGIGANLMSLSGVAVALGVMVDAAIVMIENAHRRLEMKHPEEGRAQIVIEAACEVGPSLFFSLIVILVSFLPIFALQGQEGRLFKPLAYTKTFTMAAGALLSVTIIPILMLIFIRGRIVPEQSNIVNRVLFWLYHPVMGFIQRYTGGVIVCALLMLGMTLWPASRIGSEFMPTLNEGTLLFMPVTLPGVSVTRAAALLQLQDKIIKSFPEVETVFGKAGRAETSTDPAPLQMSEITITLKPKSQWRPGVTLESLQAEMDRALQLPGVSNSWTMPIKGRVDMLSTGIRTPVGIKVFGPDLPTLTHLAQEIEKAVKTIPGTTSAYAERLEAGHYIDITLNRAAAAQYRLSMDDIDQTILQAVGGDTLTTTVEGRQRYSVNMRYPATLRDSPEKLAHNILLDTPTGAHIPLDAVAQLHMRSGPPAIRTENAQPVIYIFVDMQGRDLGSYVKEGKRKLAQMVPLPSGYHLEWSGQIEYLQQAGRTLKIVIPVTIGLIFVLLFLNFGQLAETGLVMLSVPFSLIGGIWLIWALGYNFSVAVAVGFIALSGVAAETGVIMLLYLDHAMQEMVQLRKGAGRAITRADIHQAVYKGAVERVRPKMMTVIAIIASLSPIMYNKGTGSEVMRRIAVPMMGGMISSSLLTLVVIPALYILLCEWRRKKGKLDQLF